MKPVVTAECVRCHETKKGSFFRDGETTYAHLCVKCKLEVSLTPARVEALSRDVQRALAAMNIQPSRSDN